MFRVGCLAASMTLGLSITPSSSRELGLHAPLLPISQREETTDERGGSWADSPGIRAYDVNWLRSLSGTSVLQAALAGWLVIAPPPYRRLFSAPARVFGSCGAFSHCIKLLLERWARSRSAYVLLCLSTISSPAKVRGGVRAAGADLILLPKAAAGRIFRCALV
jgi:hypothetical protein